MAIEKHLGNRQLLLLGYWLPSGCWYLAMMKENLAQRWPSGSGSRSLVKSHVVPELPGRRMPDEPKCKFLRRGKVKVSLFTLCRAPRKWHNARDMVSCHWTPSYYRSIILHLITNLPPNICFFELQAEVTRSEKKLIAEILKASASGHLKYNLLGNWCGVGVERWKRCFPCHFPKFPWSLR